MGYKLLALDVDDTLLPPNKRISDGDREAVFRAAEAGVYVTIATGRGYLGSSPIWRELKINGPVINYGGATVTDTRTNKPLYSTQLCPELVAELLELAKDLNVHAHIYQGDGIVYEAEHECAVIYRNALGLPYMIDPDIRKRRWTNVPKVLFITDRVKDLAPMLKKRFEHRLEVALSSPGFIEFNCLGVHKGSAVEWLASRMGVKRDEIIAIGDNTLDSEMLIYAGLGVAVANASPEVKAIADVISPYGAGEAVRWAIDNYICKPDMQGER